MPRERNNSGEEILDESILNKDIEQVWHRYWCQTQYETDLTR
jgi:hypothetical protein